MTSAPETRLGLRAVIAGETNICKLDEQVSDFYFYGYSIEELAEKHDFETVAYLTLFGEMPGTPFRFGPPNLDILRSVWQGLQFEPRNGHPMGLLRTAMSSLGNHFEASAPHEESLDAEREASVRFVPHVGYASGLVGRHAEGRDMVPPDPSNTYAENILLMLRGSKPSPFEARLLDIALILYTEHEFNAGSFGVRVAASTHSDMYGAAVAGESILRGPRHGGANEEVMHLLLQIGEVSNVRAFCDRFFETPGARLPGFGHAVYNLPHSRDPRVTILRPWVKELSRVKGEMRWYDMLMALEEYMAERMAPRVARGNPNAPANMDLWTAPLYYLLGIPIPMYTPLFAASRIAGWLAHYLEVRYIKDEPIIRPRAAYTGPEPRPFTPSDDFGAGAAAARG
jgi:citrate synthase